MDLTTMRESFRTETGRLDLADTGVDRFLNAGQRLLDARVNHDSGEARNFQMVKRGGFGVTFSSTCRVIHKVFVADLEGGRNLLKKGDQDELRSQFVQLFSQLGKGRPTFYIPATLRVSPDQATTGDLQAFTGYMDVLLGSSAKFNGVIFYPPADKQYMVEVWGSFYSPDLGDSCTSTWWLENHANLLLMAAQRALEVSYRNSEGVKDWDAAMQPYLAAIEADQAEQEAVDIGGMDE